MYWHHILGFEDVVAVQQLPRGSMPRNVHLRVTLMHHVRPQLQQGVNNTVHTGLVPRDEGGSEHNRIPWLNLHLMVTICHTGQGSHRLTLGTSGHQHHLVRSELCGLVHGDECSTRCLQKAHLFRDFHVADHGTPIECHPASRSNCCINGGLNAVHIGGK